MNVNPCDCTFPGCSKSLAPYNPSPPRTNILMHSNKHFWYNIIFSRVPNCFFRRPAVPLVWSSRDQAATGRAKLAQHRANRDLINSDNWEVYQAEIGRADRGRWDLLPPPTWPRETRLSTNLSTVLRTFRPALEMQNEADAFQRSGGFAFN